MRVVIVHDPMNPGRNGSVEDIDDGLARLMIRDGLARQASTAELYARPAAPAATPGPGPVRRDRRKASEGGAA